MSFSAVILAGGKSSRMGRDKALLEIGGKTLLARQIEIAHIAGASEIIISGRKGTDYSAFDGQVISDRFPDAGPLAGIEAALAVTTKPFLLVLAVDMPEMSFDFLRELSTHCKNSSGAVPRVEGEVEPLAAFYPKVAHFLAAALLNKGANTVKHFASCCAQNGLAALVDIEKSQGHFFRNCNTPEDFSTP